MAKAVPPATQKGHVTATATLSQLLVPVAPLSIAQISDSLAFQGEKRVNRTIDLAGASGALYRYTPIDEDRFLPPAGANYVIAELKDEGPTVVYAGETDNLASQAWRSDLEKARRKYAEATILTRLNVTRAVREAERNDLIDHYHPPLNG